MGKITTCHIVNSIDKKNIHLSVKWDEEEVKLTILQYGDVPLRGLTTISKLAEAADTFGIEKKQFIEELQAELAGHHEDIQFTLKNLNFRWKKKMWTRGQVRCEEHQDTIRFSDDILQILNYNSSLEESYLKLKQENENLKRINKEIEKTMLIMTEDKSKIEQNFLKQCIPLLNSKKKRIRELEERNKKLQRKQNIYEQSTDESEVEVVPKQTPKKMKTIKKRILNEASSSSDELAANEVLLKNETKQFSSFQNIYQAIENACSSPNPPESLDNNDKNDSFVLIYDNSQELVPKRKM